VSDFGDNSTSSTSVNCWFFVARVSTVLCDRRQSTSATHQEFEQIRFLAVESNTFHFQAASPSHRGKYYRPTGILVV